nr:MAG TPA: hypothetical protein [Caudoviricetes sp.]
MLPPLPLPHYNTRKTGTQQKAPRRVLAPPSEAANLIEATNQACRKIIPHPPSSRK